jgi:hypothetical protein
MPKAECEKMTIVKYTTRMSFLEVQQQIYKIQVDDSFHPVNV